MGAFENRLARFMKRPAPKDITPEEVEYLASRLDCKVEPGGKHPLKITHPKTRQSFIVPVSKGLVKPFYISELQRWFKELMEENEP